MVARTRFVGFYEVGKVEKCIFTIFKQIRNAWLFYTFPFFQTCTLTPDINSYSLLHPILHPLIEIVWRWLKRVKPGTWCKLESELMLILKNSLLKFLLLEKWIWMSHRFFECEYYKFEQTNDLVRFSTPRRIGTCVCIPGNSISKNFDLSTNLKLANNVWNISDFVKQIALYVSSRKTELIHVHKSVTNG